MTDYEYIMAQCRKFHFSGWDKGVLRECQSIMPNLTRDELVGVYRSRLLGDKHPLKETAFKVLFADKVGKREQKIRMHLYRSFKIRRVATWHWHGKNCVNDIRLARTNIRLPHYLIRRHRVINNG